MKTKKFLSMAALALVGAMMTGCSNDDDSINNPQQPENKSKLVTLTTTVGFDGGAGTRALASDGTKTFAAGDKIAVIYKNTSGETVKAVSEEISTGAGTASATFTVTLTNPDNTKAIRYIYPAAMAMENVEPDATIDDEGTVDFDNLKSQNGTLATLGSTLDLCTLDAANWTSGELPNGTLANQLAILAIKLKKGEDITSDITGMTISDGTNSYAVSGLSSASTIYVAIRPTSDATFDVTATDGTNSYAKTLTGKTYSANNGYNVTWNMLTKITWDNTNVFIAANQYDALNNTQTTPLTYEGITISFNGSGTSSKFQPYNAENGKAVLMCYGSQGDEFTFTAPLGKVFTKIEINDNDFINFTAYGDWTRSGSIIWSGTAANAVTLGGSKNTFATDLSSIVFMLEDAD